MNIYFAFHGIDNAGKHIYSNAGDTFCSPFLFYDFKKFTCIKINTHNVDNLKNSIIIFGGGGLLDTNTKLSNIYINVEKNNKCFHWGTGSNKLNIENINWKASDNEINIEDDALSNFIYVGRRDYLNNYLNKHEYVPCVSCKFKYFDYKYEIKRKVGIVEHMWLHQINLNYPKINMSLSKYKIEEIIKFMGESEIIITSSYHGMYWATLLGCKVIIKTNWSSKFDTFKYKPVILSNDLDNDIKLSKNYPNALKECRELNDNFYLKILKYLDSLN